MRAVRIILMTVLTLAVMSAAAFGTGVAIRHFDGDTADLQASEPASGQLPSEVDAVDSASPTTGPTTGSTTSPATTGTPAPTATPSPTTKPTPKPVLEPGDKGERVRELQHRLFQTAWMGEKISGVYDDATEAAVRGFQEKRGYRVTGVVDAKTWAKLVDMSRTPTRDERHNILRPGPTLVGEGDDGNEVRDVQARLKQIQWFFGKVTGYYGNETAAAVKGFQEKREIPATGEVDQRTMDRLVGMTRTPTHEELHNIVPKSDKSTSAALDPRCLTGRVLCIDKSSQTLRWVIDGTVRTTFEVRFGSDEMPTREGSFKVNFKSRDHVSSIYHTPMPFAMFFSGGQAVHYSPDFAANGYNGASHGCVNVRDRAGIEALFNQVNVGDKVIVYWS